MNTKTYIWLGMFMGSTVGGFVPSLWGAGFVSIAGFVGSTVGAFVGIWAGYRLGSSL